MRSYIFLFAFLVSFPLFAQKKALHYFLPEVDYDKNIPSPEAFLGYQIGEWHVSHDQLTSYMYEIARSSKRVKIEEYARSYENRPLLLLTITSPDNHKNIEQIRKDHIALSDPQVSKKLKIDKMPAVVYQGYSVHGNEASGSNAAMLMAYYLAAGKSKKINELLDEVVVLLDPCFNPDGFNRFAHWVNSHKSKNLVADGISRELNEVWPGGRTNHYWFDLNRDWLPVQHPESQGRIRNFHHWKPNILTDHHEMGSNSTFFFQPGIPSRTNPITPKRNQELTQSIAEFHAAELDKIGSLYYANESFDDFYYGKGSTYPDVNGCVGILFEQASSRGHLHESVNGDLSFAFAVRNQVKTSLSTLEAGKALRKDLLAYQRDFYKNAIKEAEKSSDKAYIFAQTSDKGRLNHFIEVLLRHQIKVYRTTENLISNGKTFKKGEAYVVPLEQPQYRLIRGMFEQATTFQDSLFYDVSAWTLPLAFGIKFTALNSKNYNSKIAGEALAIENLAIERPETPFSDYAYLFEWKEYYAPRALHFLLKNGLKAKVAVTGFSMNMADGMKKFNAGTIMIPAQNQAKSPKEVHQLLQKTAKENGLIVFPAATGFTPTGIDLGSPSFKNVKTPKVMLLVGEGVSGYDAGEVWHLLDQRYDIPTTMVEAGDFSRARLENYTAVVLVNGSYNGIKEVEKLKRWIREGGTLIAFRSAVNWAKSKGMANVKTKSNNDKNKKKTPERRPYEKLSADRGAKGIGGAIFEAQLDLSHPLAFGYDQEKIAVFRKGTQFYEAPQNAYASPLMYTSAPLLAGYSSKTNIEKAKNAAGIIVTGISRGKVISMADNTNFRAFWYGTNKLFANAIFFGSIIDSRSTEPAPPPPKKKE